MIRQTTYRRELGITLLNARGDRLLHHTRSSGVGHRTVERLEGGETTRSIDLTTIYMLALHYGVDLGDVVMCEDTLGPWPVNAPSSAETDAHVRSALRYARFLAGVGTRMAAHRADLLQPWWVRVEGGHVKVDLVRLRRMALALDVTVRDLLPPAFGGKFKIDRLLIPDHEDNEDNDANRDRHAAHA